MKKSLLLAIILACFQNSQFAQQAPDFNVTDAHGVTHRLYADYLSKGKTVVIKLFFTSCPPCNAIAPQVQQLYEDWGSGQRDVQFIELSTLASDTDAKVRTYETQHSLTYPGVSPQGGSTPASMPYRNGTFGTFFGTPTFIVIAPNGLVNYDVRGGGQSGTITELDRAIEATGATKSQQLFHLTGTVTTVKGRPIPGVLVYLADDPTTNDTTAGDGTYALTVALKGGLNYKLLAEKPGNFNEGLTALDLLALRKHILKVDTFKNAALLYAADANLNYAVSTLDLVTFSKLVLHVLTNIGNRTSPWQFLDKNLTFQRYYTNPSSAYGIDFNSQSNLIKMDLVGVKSGDVNDSAKLE